MEKDLPGYPLEVKKVPCKFIGERNRAQGPVCPSLVGETPWMLYRQQRRESRFWQRRREMNRESDDDEYLRGLYPASAKQTRSWRRRLCDQKNRIPWKSLFVNTGFIREEL